MTTTLKTIAYKVVITRYYSGKRVASYLFETKHEALQFAADKASKKRANIIEVFACYLQDDKLVEDWAPIFER